MLTTLHLARSFGALVEIYSPDVQIVEAGRAAGAPATRLVSQSAPPSLAGDPWTAFLFLFHDHDWEPPLLARALEASSFWIGAMGSRQTQSARGEALKTLGVDPAAIARVHGPIGLIPHTRDPATLGLSALAEIVGAYNRMRQQPI
jgi:xanthine dehydrogenase accessory factor